MTVFLVSSFPALFIYFQNAEEAGFHEIAAVLPLFYAVGIVLLLIWSAVYRSVEKGAITAVLFTFIITNFTLLESILKFFFRHLKYWHTVPIILVLGLHAAYAVRRFLPAAVAKDIVKIICLVFGVLILFNGVTNMPKIMRRMQIRHELQVNAEQSQPVATEYNGKPNIYLFLFDEYANFPQMEQQYGYENKVLKNFLEENHFSISYTSHNEAVTTTTIVTNLVNLDYLVNAYTNVSEKTTLRKQGALYTLLQEHGYAVQIIDFSGFLVDDSPVRQQVAASAATMGGESLSDLLLQKTIIYPFYTTDTAKALDSILNLVGYMSDEENLPSDSTFTMVYLCFPHTPFIVDADGHELLPGHSSDWTNQQYYLGQYKYATKLMLQMLNNILEHDKNSVILLQSDHGARGGGKYPLEFMSSPLNAVYYQGIQQLDIEGESSVNTLRIVLNHVLGTNFEMLPVPTAEPMKDEDV